MFREISVCFGIYQGPLDQVVSDRRDKFLKRYCAFDILVDLFVTDVRQLMFSVRVSFVLFVSFVFFLLYCIHATILW